ncbi:MAG: ACT domain-containing protein, partial [Lentisphaeria bacterium]|nr:ACT domain-containing protein [Lentisphaeria bacterium]
MKIIQLSLFVENRPGALNDVCRTLKENNINISTLSLADTQSFGILRLLVKEHEKARDVLEKAGFVVKTTEVLAIPVPNCPGGLAQLLDALKDCQVEYMYAFASELNEQAVMIFRFADPDKALEALKSAHSDIIRE